MVVDMKASMNFDGYAMLYGYESAMEEDQYKEA